MTSLEKEFFSWEGIMLADYHGLLKKGTVVRGIGLRGYGVLLPGHAAELQLGITNRNFYFEVLWETEEKSRINSLYWVTQK